jgi:hypothetical protein
MSMEHWCNDIDNGNESTRTETFSIVTSLELG